MARYLVANADDFGFTSDVNDGILYCHLHGVLTAATLMANGAAFEHAVQLARQTPALDVGCHLVLVQGRSLLTGLPLPASPADLLRPLLLRRIDPYAEFKSQIELIIAAGIVPTHLDTHKHTHLLPPVFRAVVRLAREFSIPFVRLPFDAALRRRRYLSRRGLRATDHFAGFRLTGSLTEQTLTQALKNLPEGSTEFMCHPGFLTTELAGAATRLKESRLRELEALTSPRIAELLKSRAIQLTSFTGLR